MTKLKQRRDRGNMWNKGRWEKTESKRGRGGLGGERGRGTKGVSKERQREI